MITRVTLILVVLFLLARVIGVKIASFAGYVSFLSLVFILSFIDLNCYSNIHSKIIWSVYAIEFVLNFFLKAIVIDLYQGLVILSGLRCKLPKLSRVSCVGLVLS